MAMRAVRRPSAHSSLPSKCSKADVSERLDGRQNLLCMTASGDVLEHVTHEARTVDHERRPTCEAERACHPETLQYLGFGIGEQKTSQMVLFGEATV